MNVISRRFTLASALIATLVVGQAFAGTVGTNEMVNATGPCNGALPSYEGTLRKRPLGLANEGATNAFISCSLTGQGSTANFQVQLALTNRGATPVTVSCTFVDGISIGVPNALAAYFTRSVDIPSQDSGTLTWTQTPPGATFSTLANFSCSLPPNVELNFLLRMHN